VNLFDLSGRSVVLTGGSGQLGRRWTQALLGAGARVAVVDRAAPPNREGVLFLAADVTDRPSLEAGLARLKATWGDPHGLVNAAALDSPPGAPVTENGPFETYPEPSLDQVLAVNVKGVVLACQVFGGAMAQAGRGSIVNIGSHYGLVSPDQRIYEYRRQEGEPFYKPVAYSASKSALLNLTRYLATYWAPQGVRVNTLTLGGVSNNQDPRFVEAYCRRVPLGRMARPEEYDGALIFLLSEASAYMTGANLVMDGGWTAW
jgi:NAD(P)-dependent dehydrogenase (short-subunit alcohol dehydrogenase family)